ncbi:hypothetical protein NFI96_007208 [Prochilodus magdalenae]|nr:hypothetical protein NFI96_007208 [Prochilodus magdalenae]
MIVSAQGSDSSLLFCSLCCHAKADVSASLPTIQLAYLPASESPVLPMVPESPVLPVVPESPVLPISVCPDMTSADKSAPLHASDVAATVQGVFKFKSAEKWSACEIQERLDDHMQEKKTRAAVRPKRPSSVELVPGQHDDMILGSNVIKHLIHDLKNHNEYWNIASRHEHQLNPEPTDSKAKPRGILIGRLVTPLWGDRWVPMTIVNPSDKAVTLKRNSKLADVSPCLAVEDFDVFQGLQLASEQRKIDTSSDDSLTSQAKDVFSKHPLDCGEAKGHEHRIRLTDERPFRLPYRRVPPAYYQKLRQVLTDMEEKGIIRKSSSEYASPLVMVWKKDEAEALSRLQVVFQRLRENGLKLAPKKCHLLQRQVEVITAMRVQDLMEDDERRGKLAKDRKSQGVYRKLTPVDWTADCEKAFDHLKTMLLECVVLAHPDFNEPFILSVDASLDGLGAVLSQVPKGESKARPVAFASKTLSASQRKYPAHRLEFMALKWSVCEKFSHWLKGHKFTVWTDNNPLTYLMSKPKLDACEIRWVSKLASFSFDLKHLPGKVNVVADALSRDPFTKSIGQRLLEEPYPSLVQQSSGVEEDSIQDVFRAGCQSQVCRPVSRFTFGTGYGDAEIRALCQGCCDWSDAAETRAVHLVQHVQQLSGYQETFPTFSAEELKLSQEGDPVISTVLPFVFDRKRPSRREKHGADSKVLRMFKQWERLCVQDGILYRTTKDPASKQKRYQYVLPESLKIRALTGIHDLAGHQGQDRTLSLARQRFYWSDMERDIRDYVKCCQRCVFGKSPEPAARAPLESIKSSAPMELAKENWPQQIQTLTFAYNATVHETSGLKTAMEIAQKHSTIEQQRQARQYNKRIKGTCLSVGDRVLVANKGERGKKKLADKWEDGVYTVIGADPSIHVYKVQDAAGHTRVVHRNLLMEVNFLPVPRVCRNEDTVGADLSLVSEEGCDDGGEATSLFRVLAQDEGGCKPTAPPQTCEEYTSSVTVYIGKCIEDVTIAKTNHNHVPTKKRETAEVACSDEGSRLALKEGTRGPKEGKAKLSTGHQRGEAGHMGQSIPKSTSETVVTHCVWQAIRPSLTTGLHHLPVQCCLSPRCAEPSRRRVRGQNGVAGGRPHSSRRRGCVLPAAT